MLMTPSLLLFWCSIMVSILFTMSTSSILYIWVALELNTLAFIPFILNSYNNSGEAALKYFLSQTFASIIYLYSLIGVTICSEALTFILLTSSLLLKMGVAPLHAWLPAMVSSLSWETLFMLLTIQKLNPLLLLSAIPYCFPIVLVAGGLSLFIGSFMGLIQTQVRKILTFSSINQVGWLILALLTNWLIMMTYFIIYMILLGPIIFLAKLLNLNLLTQLIDKKINIGSQILFFINVLSLGGLPPFLGFFPKWLVLSELMSMNFFLLSMLMIMTSLLTLFYYLRLTYNSFMMNSNQWNFLGISISNYLILLTQVNLFSLWFGMLM